MTWEYGPWGCGRYRCDPSRLETRDHLGGTGAGAVRAGTASASARSQRAARWRTRRSPAHGPTICKPTGRPSEVKPHGGLAGDVEGVGVRGPSDPRQRRVEFAAIGYLILRAERGDWQGGHYQQIPGAEQGEHIRDELTTTRDGRVVVGQPVALGQR